MDLENESTGDVQNTNPELDDLGTHQAGAVNLHETRETKEPVQINPGFAPGAIPEKNE